MSGDGTAPRVQSLVSPDLPARLTQHRTLGGAPPEEIAWLIAHGVPRTYAVGQVTTRRAQPEEWLHVVLSGRLAIHADRGAGSRKVIEWRGGDVCGLMPYSRGGAPPGDTVVEEPADTLAIHRDHLPAMARDCPNVTAALVRAMLDRARHFTSSDHHDEKLVSLGKLAAGLAHELNNPASAAASGAKRLGTALADAEAAARALAASRLSDTQLAAIDRVHEACAPGTSIAQSPMERADREDAIGAWLEAHGLDTIVAPSLTETGVTFAALDTLALSLDGRALGAALAWIADGCLLRALASDIDTSSSRVSALVAAVKGFTYVDRAPAAEPVDIRPGIRDTLVVLGAKTRAKLVEVMVEFAVDLPSVSAFGAELNQIWANLIDNALDAAPRSGHVVVTARRELDSVVVCVVDDGPGIPAEALGRIFDPFFTTKPVGEGTGLGLDIVRRLVQRHSGEIAVESRPGRTAFTVDLPVAPAAR